MVATTRFVWLVSTLVLCLGLTTGASQARNVPGSAAAATQQFYEDITTDLADGILGR